jgi:hypothetical protein
MTTTMPSEVLTRDSFRQAVFDRDGGKCLVCGKTSPLDAHHIIERRLWPNGGYYLDNGATVCDVHHLQAESTQLSCEKLRELAGITRPILPEHLYDDEIYDKWGNIILPNGARIRGELFDDVQKVLAPVLHLFTTRVKYPRTYHLPWSPGLTKDDRVMPDIALLKAAPRIIVHVKMDGENTSMYRDGLHARSLDFQSHPSRNRVRKLHGEIAHEIPKGWRLCGENLYGKHSIHYQNLRDHFYAFSLWNDRNVCLSWDEARDWFVLLGLTPCPVIYDGPFDEGILRTIHKSEFEGDACEGYVVRVAGTYRYGEYRRAVGKFVRSSHVATHAHWMQKFEPNQVRASAS